jgi:hypothetical protein
MSTKSYQMAIRYMSALELKFKEKLITAQL